MSEQMKFKIKGCSIARQCLLVDAETNGNLLSLQMPFDIAEQIVRTTNAHEDLLAACDKLKARVCGSCVDKENNCSGCHYEQRVREAEAAIAKGQE